MIIKKFVNIDNNTIGNNIIKIHHLSFDNSSKKWGKCEMYGTFT
jgi:hypothetical protein